MKSFAKLASVSVAALALASVAAPAQAFSTLAYMASGGSLTKFAAYSMIMPGDDDDSGPAAQLSVEKGPAVEVSPEGAHRGQGLSFIVDAHEKPVAVSIAYRKTTGSTSSHSLANSDGGAPIAVHQIEDVSDKTFSHALPSAGAAVQSDGTVSVTLPPSTHTQRVFVKIDSENSTHDKPVISVAMGRFGDELSNSPSQREHGSSPLVPAVGIGLVGAALVAWRRRENHKYESLAQKAAETAPKM